MSSERPVQEQVALQTAASEKVKQLLTQSQQAMNEASWTTARDGFLQASHWLPQAAQVHHNLALCQLALGQSEAAKASADKALSLNPNLWQSCMVKGNALKALKQAEAADVAYAQVLQMQPGNGEALLARADLAINVFGLPLQAMAMVLPLLRDKTHDVDAQLTTLMANVYDRDVSAAVLTQAVMKFSKQNLRMNARTNEKLNRLKLVARTPLEVKTKRPRVALISPLFCASPVYFLTILGWRHVAKGCDLVIFNRGHKSDWATEHFKELSTEWHDVQEIPAEKLALQIHAADIDVLYDLGGWMDPVALKALSIKPARQMFKWVGGQSLTTGLESFDGWIGDEWQSPLNLQHLYTEPLVNVPGGYATYTPPPYMPSVPSQKIGQPVIFSNPAKLSRAFLAWLGKVPGTLVFVHQQFQYERTRQKVIQALGKERVQFICPSSHREALQVLGRFEWMIDTFPYSSGLTAREAVAMGVKVKVFAGELFCERHSMHLSAK